MLRWCRIVANQPTLCTTVSGSQAPRNPSVTSSRAARLATTHVLRPGVAQHRLDPHGLVACRGHENAEPVVREARVVQDRAGAPRRKQRVEEDAEDRREGTEQNRHLEHDDDVGRNRPDGLAAGDDRPIGRHPERQPRADGTTGDAAHQREHPDRAHPLAQCVLDLVARDWRIHSEIGMPRPAQLLDRRDRGIEVREDPEYAGRRRRPKQIVEGLGERHHTCAFDALLRGGASTSFTSEIDTAGKFFTKSRNHMKNQPKLPAMMPQSAHVGLYVALANRSNGSPASDTTMITKRSNHIPMFTKIEITNRARMLVRMFLRHSSRGRNALQMIIVQLAHQKGPKARYQKAARSWALPLNQ